MARQGVIPISGSMGTGSRPSAAPAVGSGGSLPRRERVVRLGVLGVAALLAVGLLASKQLLAASPAARLPAVPNPVWVVPGTLLRGGQPADVDFVNLRDLYRVAAVVNLRATSTLERSVARGFGLDYLSVPVAPGRAPTDRQLEAIVAFVRLHAAAGRIVYLHDDTGLDRAPVVAVMLLQLRGLDPVRAAGVAAAGPGGRLALSGVQMAAVNALARALGHHPPYLPVTGRVGRPPAYRHPERLSW
jgi:hypothetical protein